MYIATLKITVNSQRQRAQYEFSVNGVRANGLQTQQSR